MKLIHLFENDMDHATALRNTGFWGVRGAGCIFFARSTGRFLLAHRSDAVEQPNSFGGFGGAIDSGENPEDAVRREVSEEAGYHGQYDLIPLYVFKKDTFRYYNFLVEVDDEFTPQLDWENQGYKWCEWGHWPSPLHFGLKALFSDPESVQKVKTVIRNR